jgi:hypothetical protein
MYVNMSGYPRCPQQRWTNSDEVQRKIGSAAGYCSRGSVTQVAIFPGDMLSEWLCEVERRAKLPTLAEGLWHPYRGGWASERMHFPLKAVADVGGLERCDHAGAVLPTNR